MDDIFTKKNKFLDYKDIVSQEVIKNSVKNPIISIVIPVYNKFDFFEECLESAIDQDFDLPFEIVIVDNNGFENMTDFYLNVLNRVENQKISYYRNSKNIGIFGNWNRCIELAVSELIVFLHDDDILERNALQILYNTFKKTHNSVFAAHSDIDDDGNVINSYSYKKQNFAKISLLDIFLGKSVSTGCGCLFIKKQLIEIGGFNEEYYPASDWVVNILLNKKFGTTFLRCSTAKFRVGKNNTSSKVYNQFPDTLEFCRNCMIPYMKIPRLILIKLKQVLKKSDEISSEIRWGTGKSDEKLTLADKILLIFFGFITELKWKV